jgi:hypothetical protein
MSFNSSVFRAILAMDSYNRGYGAGVSGLSQANETRIGTAKIIKNGDDAEGLAQAAGFYALAYDWNDEKIISYRGTNADFGQSPAGFLSSPGFRDIWNGWSLGAGFARAR